MQTVPKPRKVPKHKSPGGCMLTPRGYLSLSSMEALLSRLACSSGSCPHRSLGKVDAEKPWKLLAYKRGC